MFRASHRKEYGSPPQGHSRARATLPGEPFHSFMRADAQDMPEGAAVLCRFQMLPTAYTFEKVAYLLLLLHTKTLNLAKLSLHLKLKASTLGACGLHLGGLGVQSWGGPWSFNLRAAILRLQSWGNLRAAILGQS